MKRFVGKPAGGGRTSLPPRLVMFMSFAGTSIINYGFGLAAGWLLAPGDFGLLAFTQTLLTIAGLVLSSGFVWSLTADLVGAPAEKRASAIRGAMLANTALALAMSAAVLVLYRAGPFHEGLESWKIAGVVAATFPLVAVLAISRGAAQGSEHFIMLAVLFVAEVAIKGVSGLGLVALGFGPGGAVAGFLIGALLASMLGVVYLVRKLGVRPWGPITRPQLHQAGALFAALLGMALLLNLDTIGLKLFNPGDRAAVGRYQAGIVLANTPYYLLTATFPILFTQIARVKQLHRSAPMVGDTLRLALVVLLPAEAFLAAFPAVFLSILFPAAYLAGAGTLRILAVANAAIILVAVFSTAFQASGEAGIAGRVLLAITFCEVVVLSIVVPRLGSMGAASTFLAATCLSLAVLAAIYMKRVGVEPLRRSLAWLGRYGLALGLGVAMCLAVLRFSSHAILAIVAGAASYAAAVIVFRLISLPSLLGHTHALQVPLGAEE